MFGLPLADVVVFIVFVVCVIGLGIFKSRHEKTGEDYFLAGRGLHWWLIGFSLIAANISTEQFVGMSGNAASHVGLAIASYEWMAAITLVVVAFAFLPYFLRAGIYTMPEFLEYRYNGTARTIMAVATIGIYMLLVGAVTYSGALTIRTLARPMGYEVPLLAGSLVIGLIAMVYVVSGGLKACAWADLLQGSALIIGGLMITYFAFDKLGQADQVARIADVKTGAVEVVTLDPQTGPVERFWDLNKIRMNMFLPKDDPVLPWTALLLGLWIPNFYYWGLNQYITQRTLGSQSLSQGQRGIVFAAFLKLLVPFAIVIPGIIAFNLFSAQMQTESAGDNAPVLAKYLKANPATQFVVRQEGITTDDVKAWHDAQAAARKAGQSPKFLLAVYPDAAAMDAVTVKSPYVLPLTQAKFDEARPAEYTVFKTEDKSADSIVPGLVEEAKAFNKTVEEQAKAVQATTTTEKFIAYKYDTAMGQLLGKVLPKGRGLFGFIIAALLGAVVSSLAAMLNAASTIFTMDIFKKYIHPQASQTTIVLLGRICVVVFTGIAIVLAPQLGNPKISNSIFTIIQESQGFISPGILAVFVFGLLFRKAPPVAGVVGLLTSIVAYGAFKIALPQLQFLNRMAVCFVLCLVIMALITLVKPLPQPVTFERKTTLDLTGSRGAVVGGILVVAITLLLYVLFSPIGLAR